LQLDPRLLELARKKWWAFLLTLSLGILAGVLAIAQASALASAVNQVFLERKTLAETTGTILLLLVVLIVRPLLSLGSDLSAHATARLIKSDLRSRLLNQIEKLGPTYTQNEKTGSLTNILVDGVEALDAYFSQYLPGLALALLVPLSILIYVFSIDLLSGVVLLVTGPLIPFFLSLIGTMAQELTQRQWRTLNRLSAYFLDVIQGLTTLKMFGRSRQQADQIAIASEQFRKATMDILRVTFLSALTLEMCATISTAVVAVEIGLRLLYGRMEFWQAFVILILAPEFYQPLRMLGARFHSGMAGVEAARQIFGILETSSNQTADIREKTGEVFKNDNTAFFIKGINFLNVSVEFKAGRPALRGISFEMLQGQKVALVGPSGGGKSTVASLLLRFIEPEDGQILVDGHPLADIPADVWPGFLRTPTCSTTLSKPISDLDARVQAGRRSSWLPGRLKQMISSATYRMGTRRRLASAGPV
jgi:ATP-binding cassette subfamily C protein CydD